MANRPVQRLFPWLERSRRRERRFKAVVLAFTGVVVLAVMAGLPPGRDATALTWRRMASWCSGLLGMETRRAEIAAEQNLRRLRGIARTRSTYRDFYERDASPGLRRILGAAGMAPDDVLLRWANGDWTVIFSPRVFQADEGGRAYRMRPGMRSFWLEDHVLTRGLTSFFFLPDTAEVRTAVAETGAAIMPESYQTTNSWGCRGPEPDPAASRRVLVLGDSFMQGIFVADDQTPPECLRRHLESAWGERVSVLNTGHIGYSPEQYHSTLVEYYDRFRPDFVVVGVCPNDFGDPSAVLSGQGDWSESEYWLDEIQQFCRTRLTPCLLVASPLEVMITGNRRDARYPGNILGLWNGNNFTFMDLSDTFIDAHLHRAAEVLGQGGLPQTSPLFNGHRHDAHFSPLGAAAWGQAVGGRLEALSAHEEAWRRRRLDIHPGESVIIHGRDGGHPGSVPTAGPDANGNSEDANATRFTTAPPGVAGDGPGAGGRRPGFLDDLGDGGRTVAPAAAPQPDASIAGRGS
jgi:hypothetical protein